MADEFHAARLSTTNLSDILSIIPTCFVLLLLTSSHLSTTAATPASLLTEMTAMTMATISLLISWSNSTLPIFVLGYSTYIYLRDLCNPQLKISFTTTRHALKSTFQLLILALTIFPTFAPSPRSETTFGGNFNIRHLSPLVRRSLRKAPSLTPSLVDVRVPISLYIESGGFLHESPDGETVLADNIATMFPWNVKKAAYDDETRSRAEEPTVRWGDVVLLQNPITENYIATSQYKDISENWRYVYPMIFLPNPVLLTLRF